MLRSETVKTIILIVLLLFNVVVVDLSQSKPLSIKGVIQDVSGQPTLDATVTLTKEVSDFKKVFLTKLDGIFEFTTRDRRIFDYCFWWT